MTITRITLVLALALSAFAAGQPKDKKNWQPGTVLDSELQDTTQTVVIGGDDYEYTAQWGRCSKTWAFTTGSCLALKPAALTVNAPIKFAVDLKKQRLYLIDDMGKEFELDITKRVKK